MKKTIKNSMLISYMILISLTACIMSGFYIYKNYRYAREQSIGEIEKESKQALKELENLFAQIDIIQYQAVDILTQEKDYPSMEQNPKKKALDMHKEIEEEFMALRRSYAYIQDIFWLPEDSWICTTQSDLDAEKILSGVSVRQLDEDAEGPFVPVHRQDYLLGNVQGPYIFSYVKKIYNIYDIHTIRGILQIDFKYEELENRLDVINSNAAALAYVSDDEDHLVSFPIQNAIGKSVQITEDYKKEKNIHEKSYHKKYSLPNGWKLEVYMSYDSAAENFQSNMKTSILLIVLFAIGASCYAYKASKRITLPLRVLTGNLIEMERSGQLKRLQVLSEFEELQILERQYNGMAEQLDTMIEATAKARNETLRAKLAVLQMQINPHFLSNCFEMIRSQAVQSQNYEIEKITEALAMMYRYILTDMGTEVYLKDEIQYVKNYVRIQEFRFGDSVQIFYRIDKEAMKQKIPVLTIQPIVENAYKHGFSEKKHGKIIIIECTMHGPEVYVSVQDNGRGIAADELQRIQNILEAGGRDGQDHTKGIGLKNVNYRLQMCYGQKAKLEIESKPELGTKISFRVGVRKNYEGTDC